MNQGGIVPSRGEMKARLLEERVSALETKVAELSTSTNKQMAAISAAEKWVINRDIPPTGFDSFMAGVEWQKQHH